MTQRGCKALAKQDFMSVLCEKNGYAKCRDVRHHCPSFKSWMDATGASEMEIRDQLCGCSNFDYRLINLSL
jgi:hypothetical protein